MNRLIRSGRWLLLIGVLGLFSLAFARPIFCDQFESESCLVLPSVTLETTELFTFETGELKIGLEKGALPGGQDVFLSSSNPTILAVPASVRFEAGETELILPIGTQAAVGVVTIEATAVEHQSASIEVSVSRRDLEWAPPAILEVGNTVELSLTLGQPAPPGGASILVGSSDASVVAVSPSAVTLAEGEMVAPVTVSGLAEGEAELSAVAPGYAELTTVIKSFDSFLRIGVLPALVPGQQVSLPITLSRPAPDGGLAVSLQTGDPAIATVDPLIEFPQGQRLPSDPVLVTGVDSGQTLLTASSAGLATRQRSVSVGDYQLDFDEDELEVAIGWTAANRIRLSSRAPQGGLTLEFSSSNDNILAVPASLFVPEGQLTAIVEVTGVGFGSADIVVDGSGIEPNSFTVDGVSIPGISLPKTRVGQNLQERYAVRLRAFPQQPLDLVLTVADPAIAVLSASDEEVGSASVVLDPNSLRTSRYFTVQGLTVGTTTITATAPGYADMQSSLTVTPSGVYLDRETIWTTTLSGPRSLDIDSARLESDGSFAEIQTVRAGLDLVIPLNSSNPGVGVLTENPVVIPGGIADGGRSRFVPQTVGTTRITLSQPAGFTTPIDRPSGTDIQVSYPHGVRDAWVGNGLQATATIASSTSIYDLPVTLIVGDPSVALLSLSSDTVGQQSIAMPRDPAFSSGRFQIQGLREGTTTLTSVTPGLPSVQSIITVTPSGFFIQWPGEINTSSVSGASSVTVASACRLPMPGDCRQGLRPGLSVEVPVVSTNPAVGDMTVDTLVFEVGDGLPTQTTGFLPSAAGTSTIQITQPTGFSEWPELPTSIVANVEDLGLRMFNRVVGKDLMGSHRIDYFDSSASGQEIVVRSLDPSIALLSANGSAPPTAEIVLTTPVGRDWVDFYTHGIQQGETSLIAFGQNIPAVTASLDVVGSGFYISSLPQLTTTIDGGAREIAVVASAIDDDGDAISSQSLRLGVEAEVPVLVSDQTVGVVTNSPLVFNGSVGASADALFEPLEYGVTTVQIQQPAGFSIPNNGAQLIDVEVGLPALVLSDTVTGRGLQVSNFVRLFQDPLGPVDIELSIVDPTIAVISDDFDTPGSSSLTLPDIEVDGTFGFFVQGLQEGTTSIIARAPGFEDVEAQVTVSASGVSFDRASSRTTVNAEDFSIGIRLFGEGTSTVRVNPGTSIVVPIINSNPSVGLVTINPIEFSAEDGSGKNTFFDPQGLGTTTLSIGAVPGFEAVSFQSTTEIEVQQGVIRAFDQTVGRDLQVEYSFRLDRPAAEPVDVVVSLADPSVARVSSNRTQLGGASIVVTVGEGDTRSESFYLQGMNLGATTLNYSAVGYESTQSEVTVIGSGFHIDGATTLVTTHYSEPTEVRVVASSVDLNGAATVPQELRAGLSAQIPLSIGNPSVAQLSTGTLQFTGGGGASQSVLLTPNLIGETTLSMIQPFGFQTPINRRQEIDVVVQGGPIQLGDFKVGKDLQDGHRLNLGLVPPAPVDIALSVDDPSIARLSLSSSALGSGVLFLENVSSTSWEFFEIQGLEEGTTTLRAQAAGFETAEAVLTVTPAGIYINWPSSITTVVGAISTGVEVNTARLDALGRYAEVQDLRGGLVLEVPVISTDSSVGTIVDTPVEIGSGFGQYYAKFVPQSAGSTEVSVVQPPGFTEPTTTLRTSIQAEVRAPSFLMSSTNRVGRSLQDALSFRLNATPSIPVDANLSIVDPSVALISRDPELIGSTSLNFSGITNGNQQFWVQGMSQGTTTLTLSAPGYESVQAEITVSDSGFYIPSFGGTTTLYSQPRNVSVRAVSLDDNGDLADIQPVRAGLTIEVPVISSFPSVGQITESPVVFQGGELSSATTRFAPQGIGTTTVSVEQPSGFNAPGNRSDSIDFAVRAPTIELDDVHVGRQLQTEHRFSPEAVPPDGELLTFTVADPDIALLSASSSEVGSAVIQLEPTFSSFSNRFYIQGLDEGETTITVTGAGFETAVSNLTVGESGFYFSMQDAFTITPVQSPRAIVVRPAQRAANGSWQSAGQLRPGYSVNVNLSISNPAVGTLDTTTLLFEGNSWPFPEALFNPTTIGLTTIDLSQPAGFSQPDTLTDSVNVTVTPAMIELEDLSVGQSQSLGFTVRLMSRPAVPVDLTLTVSNPSVALLSRGFGAPSSSITIENVSFTNSFLVNVFGENPGVTFLTASAPGFEPRQVLVTVTSP